MSAEADFNAERDEFVSEPVRPDPGTADASAMACGIPGLPRGFTWRDRHYTIICVLREWKQSESFNHAAGERYYRKHFYQVRVDTGESMTLYAVRRVKAGESPKRRWWLYSRAAAAGGD